MLLYLLFAMPAFLLGLWAQMRVQRSFRKYSQVGLSRNLSGAEIARRILDSQGLQHVQIEPAQGFLSDHYDPRGKVLRLSPDVFQGRSVAAAGVAAHEAGHAFQDAENWFFLRVRSAMVPTVQFGSWLGPIIFLVGFFLNLTPVAWLGIGLFGAMAVFAVVTLPVEFDASKRARQFLTSEGIVFQDEAQGVKRVLDAAALTYVAAAIQAISTLLYYAFLLTGFNRD
ncbi:MAG: zinc metallopeptidase [Chloroflexi bacterium]|nr:zinc metallopeptidase [Chloroflexota bacterium]